MLILYLLYVIKHQNCVLVICYI